MTSSGISIQKVVQFVFQIFTDLLRRKDKHKEKFRRAPTLFPLFFCSSERGGFFFVRPSKLETPLARDLTFPVRRRRVTKSPVNPRFAPRQHFDCGHRGLHVRFCTALSRTPRSTLAFLRRNRTCKLMSCTRNASLSALAASSVVTW